MISETDLVGRDVVRFWIDGLAFGLELDNGIVIEPLEISPLDLASGDSLAEFLSRVGRKVLSASFDLDMIHGSSVNMVIGKDADGKCFRIRALPCMIHVP